VPSPQANKAIVQLMHTNSRMFQDSFSAAPEKISVLKFDFNDAPRDSLLPAIPEMPQSYNFLCLDDVPLNRKMLTRVLHPISGVFDSGESGVEGLALMSQHDLDYYQIILTDAYMPDMDGFSFTKKVREMGYKGLIFGVTGSSAAQDIEKFKESGTTGVMLKPLSIKMLQDAIGNGTPINTSRG
jgi:CheY-like chemotaxis protein